MRSNDIVPVPPASFRRSVPSQVWSETVEVWIAVVTAYLRSDDKQFAVICKSRNLADFLNSFYQEYAQSEKNDDTLRSQKSTLLAQQCLKLVSRAHTAGHLKSILQAIGFLEALARCHARSSVLRTLLSSVWKSDHVALGKELRQWQTATISQLEQSTAVKKSLTLEAIAPLLYSCPGLATSLFTGSDFLETVQSSYLSTSDKQLQHALTLVVYLGLIGSMTAEQANPALLSDNLYSLKANAEARKGSTSLLADLVTNTPVLNRVQRFAQASNNDRLTKLVESLRTFQTPSIARIQKKKRPHNVGKGKQKASADTDLHIHRMSLVTQIQDLFPDLGAGFVLRLLDAFDDNVEEVTAHLLEDSLPSDLKQANRHEPAPVFDADRAHVIDNLVPRATPSPPPHFLPERRNAYDDDELDRLDFDTSKLHIGKREQTNIEGEAPNKAAIMAALAAFDSDDDERDDTYDAEDVGGMVDTGQHGGDDGISAPFDENDMKLYKHFEATPEVFRRSADTRRSQARAVLKKEVGMTDEAIEGWAIMLQRDPRRARKLAFEASRFDGRQTDIARTSYREGRDTEGEDSDGPRQPSFRGRGRGRGGIGRGGNATPSVPQTDAAKRRKEANKSSRANHNRRNQRAKKMARGGFAGAS